MRYGSILKEIWQRVNFHATTGVTIGGVLQSPMLAGLNVKKSGEWRIDGDQDLPRFTICDLNATEIPGNANARLSMFLSTRRADDWFRSVDDGTLGLIDWMELLMDAVETRPSDGQADQLLTVHNADGTAMFMGGQPFQLLTKELTWETKMAEINDLSMMMQVDLLFTPVMSRKPTRRSRPIPPAA